MIVMSDFTLESLSHFSFCFSEKEYMRVEKYGFFLDGLIIFLTFAKW